MSDLTLEIAKKMIGKPIKLSNEHLDEVAEAKVSQVIESKACGPEWENFSIIIDLGETPPEINQGIYALSSEDYSNEQLFISPNSHTECEIIISRKLTKS